MATTLAPHHTPSRHSRRQRAKHDTLGTRKTKSNAVRQKYFTRYVDSSASIPNPILNLKKTFGSLPYPHQPRRRRIFLCVARRVCAHLVQANAFDEHNQMFLCPVLAMTRDPGQTHSQVRSVRIRSVRPSTDRQMAVRANGQTVAATAGTHRAAVDDAEYYLLLH